MQLLWYLHHKAQQHYSLFVWEGSQDINLGVRRKLRPWFSPVTVVVRDQEPGGSQTEDTGKKFIWNNSLMQSPKFHAGPPCNDLATTEQASTSGGGKPIITQVKWSSIYTSLIVFIQAQQTLWQDGHCRAGAWGDKPITAQVRYSWTWLQT